MATLPLPNGDDDRCRCCLDRQALVDLLKQCEQAAPQDADAPAAWLIDQFELCS